LSKFTNPPRIIFLKNRLFRTMEAYHYEPALSVPTRV
jgi:hypothetical protein